MRPVPSFHWRYPDVRAVRLALAAGAVAGLVVIAACTDNGGKSITAPSSGPRNATIQTGTLLNATFAKVCVDAGAPPGTYKFTNSFLRRMNKGMGGDGTTNENNPAWNRVWAAGVPFRVGALTNAGGPTTPKTSDAVIDPTGDIQVVTTAGTSGGAQPAWNAALNGTTTDNGVVWTNRGPAEYVVGIGPGGCATVLTRTIAISKFCNRLVSPPEGLGCGPAPLYPGVSGETNEDPFSGMVVKVTSMPSGVTYNHTDCLLDLGVLVPKDAFRDATFLFGHDNDAGNECGTNNNPSTVFANIQHGMQLTFFFDAEPIVTECVLGYPDNSHLPRSAAEFNESEVLRTFGYENGKIHAWYNDEHALTLGVDSVFQKNPGPDFGFSYPIEKMSSLMTGATTAGVDKSPSRVLIGRASPPVDPPVGQGDPLDGAGRPLYPALFITDLTVNGASSRIGDWQQGPGSGVTGLAPNRVYGSWKGAVLTIDNTHTPAVTTIKPKADPAKNHNNYGPGGTNPVPAVAVDQGYGTDIVWNIANIPGYDLSHDYRAVFMVHDGDQNKTGGDVGEACINIIHQ